MKDALRMSGSQPFSNLNADIQKFLNAEPRIPLPVAWRSLIRNQVTHGVALK